MVAFQDGNTVNIQRIIVDIQRIIVALAANGLLQHSVKYTIDLLDSCHLIRTVEKEADFLPPCARSSKNLCQSSNPFSPRFLNSMAQQYEMLLTDGKWYYSCTIS